MVEHDHVFVPTDDSLILACSHPGCFARRWLGDHETAESITEWAQQFCPVSLAQNLAKAMSEVGELAEVSQAPGARIHGLLMECADVAIVLARTTQWTYESRILTALQPTVRHCAIGATIAEVATHIAAAYGHAHTRPASAGMEIRWAMTGLANIAARYGADLAQWVDIKMAANRQRTWTRLEDGRYRNTNRGASAQ